MNTTFSLSRSASVRVLAAAPTALALFVVALALRLYCLDCRSLWGDEVASVEVAQRGITALLTDRFGWMQVQTAFHYLLVWLSLQPADPSATAFFVRLPSALAGAATPLLVYALGRDVFGRWVGTAAAVMVALSPVYLNYSQDLRPYAVLTFLTVASAYCLLKAEQTGAARWWALFALSASLNVLNAYVALTLVLPSLALYSLLIVWKLWRRRAGEGKRPLGYALMSGMLVGIISAAMLADLSRVPRIPPNLGLLSPEIVLMPMIELLSWFAQFGLSGPAERLLQLALILLAVFGVYVQIKRGHAGAALLCGLLVYLPPLFLAVLGTTNAVFQRYALFSLPFYFLFVASGLDGLLSHVKVRAADHTSSVRQAVSLASMAVVSLLFVYADLLYFSPENHAGLTFRPDFRGVANYLSRQAKSGDLLVFVGWDATVSRFYWRNHPPAPVVAAADPALFRHKVTGSIYWIISYDGKLSAASLADPAYSQARQFDDVLVLREPVTGGGLDASLERIAVAAKGTSIGGDHLYKTLHGSVLQGRGSVAEAARFYRSAGTYFASMGEEYLRTAKGFEARGDEERAWRDALVSKGMQPQNPDLHRWLAAQLREKGMESESRTEEQLTAVLRGGQ